MECVEDQNGGKSKLKIVIVVLIIFAVMGVGFFVLSKLKTDESKFSIDYRIQNLAGIEDASYGQGLDYQNTFKVFGTIKLENYKSKKIIIRAKAKGEYNNFYVPIFTVLDYTGNGIYDFSMSSFYKNGVQWVTRIDDLIVAEA